MRQAISFFHGGRGLGALALLLAVCTATGAHAAQPALLTDTNGDKLIVGTATTALEGVLNNAQMAVTASVIRGDEDMSKYLSNPDLVLTAFPASDNATKAFLRSVGKYAGVALQNETFTKALFDFTLVPGKAWSTAELREAAPIKLKTLGGEMLQVEKDPKAPYGILIDGVPIALANQATKNQKVVQHMLAGMLIPPSQEQQVQFWQDGAKESAGGAGAAGAAAAATAGDQAPLAAAASSAGCGAHGAVAAAVAAAAAVVAVLL